jgi:hypothetical protein
MIKSVKRLFANIFLFFLCFLFIDHSPGLADTFWIIENPSALVIYNHYEQRISASDFAAFSKYSLWQILKNNVMLSDQFRHALKAAYQKQIFYIQISSDGNILNRPAAGKIIVIDNAQLLGDTIQVLGQYQMSALNGTAPISLTDGSLLLRLFYAGGKTYLEDLNNGRSGWIKDINNYRWRKYHPVKSENIYDKQIFQEINNIFHSFNERFEKLFVYLNHQYQEQHEIPQWTKQLSPEGITYSLEPAVFRNRFPETQSYLIKRLQDLLKGSDYLVGSGDGIIKILKTKR